MKLIAWRFLDWLALHIMLNDWQNWTITRLISTSLCSLDSDWIKYRFEETKVEVKALNNFPFPADLFMSFEIRQQVIPFMSPTSLRYRFIVTSLSLLNGELISSHVVKLRGNLRCNFTTVHWKLEGEMEPLWIKNCFFHFSTVVNLKLNFDVIYDVAFVIMVMLSDILVPEE